MPHPSEQDTCGDPQHETALIPGHARSRWHGLDLEWIGVSPHVVRAELTAERAVLVMIDSGSARVDFRHGQRAMELDLRPGSIGLFTRGTELNRSRWHWHGGRRVVVALDSAAQVEPMLAEPLRRAQHQREFEFVDDELAALVRSMVAEAAGGSPNGRLFAQSLSLGLALRLHHRASARLGMHRERGRFTPAQARRVESLVHSVLGSDLSISTLADEAGFTPSQFVRMFKNTFQCTPHRYVVKARLDRARELVVAGKLPLAAIAVETGFASQSHMTMAFVRSFGAPPGALRRQLGSSP
jgi:AraC family transcriptional regulator